MQRASRALTAQASTWRLRSPPLGPSLSLGTDAFTVAGPPRWRLLSVVPWAGAQVGPVSLPYRRSHFLLARGPLCEATII